MKLVLIEIVGFSDKFCSWMEIRFGKLSDSHKGGDCSKIFRLKFRLRKLWIEIIIQNNGQEIY